MSNKLDNEAMLASSREITININVFFMVDINMIIFFKVF